MHIQTKMIWIQGDDIIEMTKTGLHLKHLLTGDPINDRLSDGPSFWKWFGRRGLTGMVYFIPAINADLILHQWSLFSALTNMGIRLIFSSFEYPPQKFQNNFLVYPEGASRAVSLN